MSVTETPLASRCFCHANCHRATYRPEASNSDPSHSLCADFPLCCRFACVFSNLSELSGLSLHGRSQKSRIQYELCNCFNPHNHFGVKSWCNLWLTLNAQYLFGSLSSLLHTHCRCSRPLEMKALSLTTIYSLRTPMALRPFFRTLLRPLLCMHPARILCRSKHRSLMSHLYCQQAETTTSFTVLCIGSFQVIRHGIHRRRTSTRLGQTQPISPTALSLCRRADRTSRVRQS